ncbi:MAG: AMP-binding protein [Gammaproteobacteria bacterium]
MNKKSNTVVDYLLHHAQTIPEHKAFTFLADGIEEQEYLTYAKLDKQARAIAAILQQKVRPKDRVLLCYFPGLDFVTAFMGCLYADAIAVPTYPLKNNRHGQRLLKILSDCEPSLILGTQKSLEVMQAQQEFSHYSYLHTDAMNEDSASLYRHHLARAKDLAFLQYTSGSTGKPKGVMVSHANICANVTIIQQHFHGGLNDIAVSWLPVQHDMGIIGNFLYTLCFGTREIWMAPAAFLEHPIRWLAAIDKYGANICGSPNFGYQLCVDNITEKELAGIDLSKLEIAYVGSEPVRAETLQQFTQKFAPYGFNERAFLPCYGMAETTLLISCVPKEQNPTVVLLNKDALTRGCIEEDPSSHYPLVSCGYIDKSYTAKIINATTLEVAQPGEVGEVWIRGPSVAQGYWGKPTTSKKTFHAQLANDKNFYLRTGDLGFILQDQLYITGRLKDLIIMQGRNIYPQDIEKAIEITNSAIRPGCSAAFPLEINNAEQLIVVAEIKRSARKTPVEQIFHSMRQAVFDAVEVVPYHLILLPPLCALRTTSGKIQRKETKSAYLAGELPILAADEIIRPMLDAHPKYQQIEHDLRVLLAKALSLETSQIDVNQNFSTLNGTSIHALIFQQQVMTYVAGRFDLSPTLAFDYPTITDLARYLYKRFQAEIQGTTHMITNLGNEQGNRIAQQVEQMSDEKVIQELLTKLNKNNA